MIDKVEVASWEDRRRIRTGNKDWNTVFIEMFLLIVLFFCLSTRITINYRYNTVGVEKLVNGCTVSCRIVTEQDQCCMDYHRTDT